MKNFLAIFLLFGALSSAAFANQQFEEIKLVLESQEVQNEITKSLDNTLMSVSLIGGTRCGANSKSFYEVTFWTGKYQFVGRSTILEYCSLNVEVGNCETGAKEVVLKKFNKFADCFGKEAKKN